MINIFTKNLPPAAKIPAVIAGRIIQGMTGAYSSVSIAYIADLSSKEEVRFFNLFGFNQFHLERRILLSL